MSTAEKLAPSLPEPGIYIGMPMDEYLALPYMSASRLETLRRSPLQYRHSLTERPSSSPALETGTALHMAILEPERFATHYTVAGPCMAVLGSGARKGEPCGAAGAFLHTSGWLCGTHVRGKLAEVDTSVSILSADAHAMVLGMRDAVMAHPRARTLFQGKGDFESTVIFDDPATGIRCKVRPDRLVRRAGMLVDIKTTRDAAPWAFPRQAESLGYWRKLALYRRALRAVGWPYSTTALVVPESSPPFDLVCYLVDEADLNTADNEIANLLALYVECERSGEWPGYASEFQTLRRPAWAARDNEEVS